MSSFNRVILMGNVVQDIDLRTTPSGTSVTDLRLAVDDARGKGEGETVFIDVTLWGRTAEVASEYLSKGDPVLVEGRLQMDNWETPEGVKRSKIKMVADKMKLIGSRKDNGQRVKEDNKNTTKKDKDNSTSKDENVPF